MGIFYEGYDPSWVLGRDKGPPVESKPKPAPAPDAKKEPSPIELKVPFCCEKCEEKMRAHLLDVDGVDRVILDSGAVKVTVIGKVKPEDCLKAAKRVVKRSEFWPKKKEEGKKDDKKKADPPEKKEKEAKEKEAKGKEVKEAKEDKKEAAPAKKEGPAPPIELNVAICCEGCAGRLYDALKDVDDVGEVNLYPNTGKITVTGKAKPEKVLKVVRKVKPAAQLVASKKK